MNKLLSNKLIRIGIIFIITVLVLLFTVTFSANSNLNKILPLIILMAVFLGITFALLGATIYYPLTTTKILLATNINYIILAIYFVIYGLIIISDYPLIMPIGNTFFFNIFISPLFLISGIIYTIRIFRQKDLPDAKARAAKYFLIFILIFIVAHKLVYYAAEYFIGTFLK